MVLLPAVVTAFAQQLHKRLDAAFVIRYKTPSKVEPPQQGLQIFLRARECASKQFAQGLVSQLEQILMQQEPQHVDSTHEQLQLCRTNGKAPVHQPPDGFQRCPPYLLYSLPSHCNIVQVCAMMEGLSTVKRGMHDMLEVRWGCVPTKDHALIHK